MNTFYGGRPGPSILKANINDSVCTIVLENGTSIEVEDCQDFFDTVLDANSRISNDVNQMNAIWQNVYQDGQNINNFWNHLTNSNIVECHTNAIANEGVVNVSTNWDQANNKFIFNFTLPRGKRGLPGSINNAMVDDNHCLIFN